MRLIKCDRCTAIFPAEAARTELRIFDVPGGELVFAPTETKELCAVCRRDLDNWLSLDFEVRDEDTCAMGDERPCVHGTRAGRYCATCETPPAAVTDPGPPESESADSARSGRERDKVSPPTCVTARCQDCTRTFRLTGVPLTAAVEQHELKHGHVVTVLDDEENAS